MLDWAALRMHARNHGAALAMTAALHAAFVAVVLNLGFGHAPAPPDAPVVFELVTLPPVAPPPRPEPEPEPEPEQVLSAPPQQPASRPVLPPRPVRPAPKSNTVPDRGISVPAPRPAAQAPVANPSASIQTAPLVSDPSASPALDTGSRAALASILCARTSGNRPAYCDEDSCAPLAHYAPLFEATPRGDVRYMMEKQALISPQAIAVIQRDRVSPVEYFTRRDNPVPTVMLDGVDNSIFQDSRSQSDGDQARLRNSQWEGGQRPDWADDFARDPE